LGQREPEGSTFIMTSIISRKYMHYLFNKKKVAIRKRWNGNQVSSKMGESTDGRKNIRTEKKKEEKRKGIHKKCQQSTEQEN
jgi:hypothetical protein